MISEGQKQEKFMNKKYSVKYSFAFKISLYITTSIIIIFLFVLSYNYYITRKTILTDVESYMKILASSTIDKIDNELSAAQQIPEDLSYVLEYTTPTKEEIDNLLKNIVKNNEQIYGALVAFEPYIMDKSKYYFTSYFYEEPKGITHYADIGTEEYNYFKKEWYTLPKELNKGVWTEPYFEKKVGMNIVAYSRPFYKTINGERIFCGVVLCEISIDTLRKYVEDIKLCQTGFAFLLSSKGIYLAHRNKEYVIKESIFSLAKKYNHPEYMTLVEKMINRETGITECYSISLQKESIISYTPLAFTGWLLAIVVPKDEIFSELSSITLELFLMGLFGYFLSLVFIIIFAKKITFPLVKLTNATDKIGKGDFETKIPNISSTDEIGILSRAFCSMQENLVKYITSLKETTAAKEKIEQELSIAREIQQSLLPHKFPLLKQISLYATLIPAKEVGGDLYDFFLIDEKHFCFAIGDVSENGVPAALFMAVAKTLLRAKIGTMMDPAKVLDAMNKDLCEENESGMFVTFFLGILNIETGVLKYCNAGHPPPLIHTANKGFYFHTEDVHPPLGITADVNYVGNKLELLLEDILFLYTDGVTEAMNIDNVQFSEERLIDVLDKNKDEMVSDIINNIKTAVGQYASGMVQSDDITMLILKYNGKH